LDVTTKKLPLYSCKMGLCHPKFDPLVIFNFPSKKSTPSQQSSTQLGYHSPNKEEVSPTSINLALLVSEFTQLQVLFPG
jgi:hypothetical protein